MSWTEQPTLTGRHVTLRPMQREDRGGLLTAFADGFDGTFTTTVPDATTIDTWFDQLESEQAVARAMPFTVLDADDGSRAQPVSCGWPSGTNGWKSAGRSTLGACGERG